MRFTKQHIILSLLVLSLFSLTSNDNLSFKSNYLAGNEFEESIYEIDEVNSKKEVFNSDDGGDDFIIPEIPLSSFVNTQNVPVKFSFKKQFLSKKHLYLLYCCLKIDC